MSRMCHCMIFRFIQPKIKSLKPFRLRNVFQRPILSCGFKLPQTALESCQKEGSLFFGSRAQPERHVDEKAHALPSQRTRQVHPRGRSTCGAEGMGDVLPCGPLRRAKRCTQRLENDRQQCLASRCVTKKQTPLARVERLLHSGLRRRLLPRID